MSPKRLEDVPPVLKPMVEDPRSSLLPTQSRRRDYTKKTGSWVQESTVPSSVRSLGDNVEGVF